jgi:hypothetical protein
VVHCDLEEGFDGCFQSEIAYLQGAELALSDLPKPPMTRRSSNSSESSLLGTNATEDAALLRHARLVWPEMIVFIKSRIDVITAWYCVDIHYRSHVANSFSMHFQVIRE